MFTIEEDSGTYSDIGRGTRGGTRRRHNGYYAGDFSQAPMLTTREISALTKLRAPTFPSASGSAG